MESLLQPLRDPYYNNVVSSREEASRPIHMKNGILIFLLMTLTSCVSQEQRDAVEQTVQDYRAKGYTCHTGPFATYDCFTPYEQERLDKLEAACVEGGGIADYSVTGYYSKCKRPRSSGSRNTFKPYCPPSDYPIYGCDSSSGSKPPPGNKVCTYKSGPYKWSKTISGFTCPATDNKNGIFGTLVR